MMACLSRAAFATRTIPKPFIKSPPAARAKLHNLKQRLTPPISTPAKLISAPQLRTLLTEDPDSYTILDVRGHVKRTGPKTDQGFQPVAYITDDEAYLAGHIPTAAFLDWQKITLSNHVDFADHLSTLGVHPDKPVILYDGGNMLFATRAWLALKALSIPDVAVLQRGWADWDTLGAPVSLETLCPLKNYSEFESPLPAHQLPPETVSLEEMRTVASGKSHVTLIDARSRQQFLGEEWRSRRAGHIPGAVNMPYRELLCPDRIGFRPDDELDSILKKHGLLDGDDKNFMFYCNGGVSSTVVLFALVRCGIPLSRMRNYCGSWNEWGNLDDVPIAVGE